MSEIKELLRQALIDRFEKGEETITKDGNLVRMEPKPATLTVALNYLKTFPPEDEVLPQSQERSDHLQNLTNKMKFNASH